MKDKPTYKELERRVQELESKVTSYKAMEGQRPESNEFLEAVLRCTANGIVACDQNGILSFFNNSARKFHGLPMAPIASEEWADHYDLYDEDGKTPLNIEKTPLFRALQGEEVLLEKCVIAPKGLPARTVCATGQKLIDSNGNNLGAVVSLDDITAQTQAEKELKKVCQKIEENVKERTQNLIAVNEKLIREIFERKQVEETLQESEKKYRLLSEKSGDLVFSTRIFDGTYEYISPSVIELLGCEANEFYDNSQLLVDLLPEEWKTFFYDKWEEINEGQRPHAYEYPIIHKKSGKVRWMRQKNDWIYNDKGELVALQGRVEDITEQKETKDQLRNSENNLRIAQAIVHLGHWELIPKTGEVSGSDELYKIFRLSKENNTLDAFLEITHPGDREYVDLLLDDVIQNGIPWDIDYRLSHENGSIRWVHAKGEPQFDAQGEIVKIIGTVRDITTQKSVEDDLKKANENFRLLSEVSPSGIWQTNAKGDNTYVSQRWSSITGITEDDAKGTGWSQGIHPEDKERVFAGWYGSTSCDSYYTSEFRFVRPDGEIVWVVCLATPMKDNDQEIIGWVGTITDISDRKRAEIALLKSHRELEDRVVERTKQLEKKTQRLEEVNTALKILLQESGTIKLEIEEKIRHNLKESVLPYLTEIELGPPQHEIDLYIDTIKSNIDRITSSFSNSMSLKYQDLTPREIQVADFIRQGKSNKDIARLLRITPSAIDFHRSNLRAKLNLKGKKINLRSYLLESIG